MADKQAQTDVSVSVKDSTFHGLVIHSDGVVLLWAAVVEVT